MAEQVYVARVTANAIAAGRFIVLEVGEPMELSEAEADELLRLAFVVKASKGKAAHDNGDEVLTASLEPERRATSAAQNAKSRKGTAG